MNNNDVIRRLRYIFDFEDAKMIEIFALAGGEFTRAQISNWLKPDTHEEAVVIKDRELSIFLNGFIVLKRGKREGVEIVNEKKLNNNQILRKLKIAFNMKSEEILDTLDLADFYLSKHELSAFFRKPTQSQYRDCKDQVLRNFIHGLQIRFRKEG